MTKHIAKELAITDHKQCEAHVGRQALTSRLTWSTSKGETRCRNEAKYYINGANLCGRHAEVVALNILLAESQKEA